MKSTHFRSAGLRGAICGLMLFVVGPGLNALWSGSRASSSESIEIDDELVATRETTARRGTVRHEPRRVVRSPSAARRAPRENQSQFRFNLAHSGHRLSNGLMAPLRL